MTGFPGYSDVRRVGEGGLGNLYRAVRDSTGGVVAIKELRDVGVGSPVGHRARRELEALLRLKGHPYVVSVEEIIEGPAGPCLVMEFATGGSLMDRLASGPFTGPELVLVGQHVALALNAAHDLGIVHRDVKPHNLLIGSFGQVKVCDFGIAALVRGAEGRTQTQAITLTYASPEELDGAEEVGPPADVYSFGATLLHLATGRRPSFRDRMGSDLGEELAANADPIVDEVLDLIRECLARDPENRPTMTDLASRFDEMSARLGQFRIQGFRVTAPARAAFPEMRNPPQLSPQAPTVQRSISASERTVTTARAAADGAPEPSLGAQHSPSAHRRPVILVGGLLLALVASAGAVAVIASAGRDEQTLSGPASLPDAQNQRAGEDILTPAEVSDSIVSSASSPTETSAATAATFVSAETTEVVEAATALTLSTPIVEPIHPVNPRGVAVAEDGSVVFTDDHRVVRIESDGSTRVLAGGASPGVVNSPEGVALRPDGTVVFADNGSNRVMSISPSGVVSVLAGTGAEGFGGDGGAAANAVLDGPVGVAIMPDGSVVFADNGNHRIRRIDPSGVIATVAGSGAAGLGGDGAALTSPLNKPQGVVIERDGSIVIADTFNHRVRRLGTDGTILTIAGNGTKGSDGDGGPATSAQLSLPVGVAVLPDGSIAVADYGNGKIRVVHPDGTISTLAGAGAQGYSGDGGPATLALLNKPQGVAVTAGGAVVVTDTENWRLRLVSAGTITTLLA